MTVFSLASLLPTASASDGQDRATCTSFLYAFGRYFGETTRQQQSSAVAQLNTRKLNRMDLSFDEHRT